MTLHVHEFETLCDILLQAHVQFVIHSYSPKERRQCREPAGTGMPLGTNPPSASKEFPHWKNLMVHELSTVDM